MLQLHFSVGIDYSNDRTNRKTKTLGTLGEGTVEVANVAASNTKMLNRDIKDNTVDIYNISSHKGLKGTVDTRVFTADGRKSIKEDLERSKRLGQSIGDVATNDAFKIGDTFNHIGDVQKDLDIQKAFALKTNGKDIKTLQGDGSTIKEKQAAVESYAQIYADVYGINIEKARIIATSKFIGGTSYTNKSQTRSEVAINDNTHFSTLMGGQNWMLKYFPIVKCV